MLKFLYICDTHFGDGAADAWHIQPRCPELMPVLFERLGQWIAEQRIDFVLHGGDAVEHATPGNITTAVNVLSRLPCPVYLCLGNHDLFGADALDLWLRHSPHCFPGGEPNYVVDRPEMRLIVLAHHWHDLTRPHYWDEQMSQAAVLDASQRDLLARALAESVRRGVPCLLALHSPVIAMRPDEAAAELPDETLSPALFSYLRDLAQRYASFKLLLAAHSHVNRIRRIGSLPVVATAAFGESPFDARLITPGSGSTTGGPIRVETINFASLFNLPAPYDASRAFAQGGPADRSALRP